MARAAAARGTAMGLSSFASNAGRGGGRGQPPDLLPDLLGRDPRPDPRADRAGPGGRGRRADRHLGLVLLPRARLGQPGHPRDARPASRWPRFAPEALLAPRWFCTLRQVRAVCPTSRRPTWRPRAQTGPTFFGAYGEWMQTPPPSWEDVAWLREQWGGPVHAQRASPGSTTPNGRSTRASAPSRCPTTAATTSTARRPPSGPCQPIAEAVGDQIEVLLDGGIRRGSDVVKARGPGGQGRDDRAGLPVGSGRQRAGRGGERARPPAQRHRVGAARPRATPPSTNSPRTI